MDALHPLIEYIKLKLESENYEVSVKDSTSISVFRRVEGRSSVCRIEVRLPKVRSDYLFEVELKGRGECVEEAVKVARIIEKEVDSLFNTEGLFSKIKELGLGLSISPTGFIFNISKGAGRPSPARGEKTAPQEIVVRIGLYTLIKFSNIHSGGRLFF